MQNNNLYDEQRVTSIEVFGSQRPFILKKENHEKNFMVDFFSYSLSSPPFPNTNTPTFSCYIKSPMENGVYVLLFPSNFHITYTGGPRYSWTFYLRLCLFLLAKNGKNDSLFLSKIDFYLRIQDLRSKIKEGIYRE
jgi:hypothetical protein